MKRWMRYILILSVVYPVFGVIELNILSALDHPNPLVYYSHVFLRFILFIVWLVIHLMGAFVSAYAIRLSKRENLSTIPFTFALLFNFLLGLGLIALLVGALLESTV